jgi:hypothetical protein
LQFSLQEVSPETFGYILVLVGYSSEPHFCSKLLGSFIKKALQQHGLSNAQMQDICGLIMWEDDAMAYFMTLVKFSPEATKEE